MVMYSPLMMTTIAYLVIGLAITASAFAQMSDEIDMSISAELDDESERTSLRTIIAIMFVLSWPLVLPEILKRR